MPLKVRVRNFQSVEDAEMVIEGLTVCTGTNNAGKSAFFRAVRGALTNARGSDFVRFGEKHCVVDIEDLETGQTLTWKKGSDGTNDYVVNGVHYPKVGHGVPPEARIFGVDPITVGNAELWPQIAPQITGVSFLLDQTGSAIAEAVADVERVNQLGRALKDCESERRSTRGELKTRRKDAEVLLERRESFAGLDAVLASIGTLEERRDKCDKIARARANMAKLGERHRRAVGAVRALDGLDAAWDRLPSYERVQEAREATRELAQARRLRDQHRDVRELVASLDGLEGAERALPSEARVAYAQQFRRAIGLTVDLAMRFEEAQEELLRAEEAAKVADAVTLDSAAPEKATRIRKAITSARSLRDRRARAREEVSALDQQVAETAAELEQLSARISEALGALGECPTCGMSLDRPR